MQFRSVVKYCLPLLAFFIAVRLHAQTAGADSLIVFQRLDSLYDAEHENNPAEGIRISTRQQLIATRLNADTLLIRAQINKGQSLAILGFIDLALKEYYAALNRAEKIKAYRLSAINLYQMGMVFQTLADFKKSDDLLLRARQDFIAAKSYRDTVFVNYELGFNCIASQNNKKGISIIKENLDAAIAMNDSAAIVLGYDNLANVYAEDGKIEVALQNMLAIAKYPEGFKSNYRKTGYNEHLAELYVLLRQWDNAKKYLTETFRYAKLINSNDWLFECYKLQSLIAEGTGQYKEALAAHKTYLELKDSVFKRDYENKVAAMAAVYDLERKQAQISLLEKDNELSKANIARKIFQRNVIIVCSLLLLAMVALLFMSWMQRKTKQLQVAFSRSLMQNQEMERQRISRELHDSVGQNVLFIKNQLSAKAADLEPVMETIAATIDEIRNISKELYPNQLEKYGLSAAVEGLAEKAAAATGLFVSADMIDIEKYLDRDAKINLYRIVQESLNNIIKHAAAKAVRITGELVKGKIVVVIMDNGKGFDKAALGGKAQTSFGVLNMEERAKMMGGKMELESSDAGTKIMVTIPVSHEV